MKNIITNNTKVFRLFGKSGNMEEVQAVPELPIGCKIYCYGYAMSESIGAVISPKNEYGQYKCVYISDFNSGFFTVDEFSRPHSKKFGIGNYFDDNFEIYDDSVLEEYIMKAEISVNIQNQLESDKATLDKLELDSLPGLYPYLIINHQGDHKITKNNLIAELKKNFPKVKFSIKKTNYSTYNISWIDGPSQTKVEEIAEKFEGYETDQTGDYRDYNPSNFNKIFGDFKYVFYSRKASETVAKCKENLSELIGTNSNIHTSETGDIFYRTFRNTSFPFDINDISIQMKNNYSGSFTDSFEFVFDKEVEVTPDVYLVDYSDKAIAVFGNTKEIKEKLKEIGGKFNNYLTYNDVKQAGWIFSKKKESELKKFLNQRE